jgi:hypothetical protein
MPVVTPVMVAPSTIIDIPVNVSSPTASGSPVIVPVQITVGSTALSAQAAMAGLGEPMLRATAIETVHSAKPDVPRRRVASRRAFVAVKLTTLVIG